MIFVISEGFSKIERVESKSFVTLDVWERKHIQEWVRSHPEILGEDLLIVGMEFDKFEGSKDRLDLLSVDREGNLVSGQLGE
jgi:RecB family endonuclease NucS